MDVELKHLRAFVAVAEELNFTRAAARLHMAQQALSSQVRRLEERIGVQLVERTTRKVELTAAGAVLLEEARAVLEAADRAVAATRAADQRTTILTVGLVEGQTPRAGSDLLVLKGPFKAGTTRKGTVKQDTPLHYSPVTKHYRVTVKRGRKGKLTVKLHVNFSFQSLGYSAFGDPRLEGWVCRADGSFSVR